MKKVLLAVVILIISVFPSLAQASWGDDNFNDNSMNTNFWTTMILENEDGGAKDNLSFFEQNQRLEWITPSQWTDNSDVSGGYASKWAFILDRDFAVNVDFHYDHTAAFPSDEGGVFLGVASSGLSYMVGIAARNHGGAAGGDIYQIGGNIPEFNWTRTLLFGQLSAWYSALEDKLYLGASEGDPVVIPGIKSSGINELSVGLEGWSGGAKLNGYDAYLDNFTVTKGHMTPEPISCVLFLVGGGALALMKKRRIRKR